MKQVTSRGLSLLFFLAIHALLFSQNAIPLDSLQAKLSQAKSLRHTAPDKALHYAEMARDMAQAMEQDKERALALQLLSRLYAEKGDYLLAVEAGLQALRLFQTLELTREVCITQIYLGVIYRYQRQFEQSLNYYKAAEQLAISEPFDSLIAGIWGNIGNVYYDLNDLDKALDHHLKSLEVDQRLGNTHGISNSLHNIGLVYREKGLFEKAIQYYQQSLDLDKEQGNLRNIGISHLDFAELYIEKKAFQKALQSANQALEIAAQIQSIRLKSRAIRFLPIIHAGLGEMDKALAFNKEAEDLTDSLSAADLGEKIAELQTKYDAEQQEIELSSRQEQIDAQQTYISQQRQFILGLSLVFALAALVTYLLFNRYKLKQTNRQLQLKHQQLELKQETEQIRQINEIKSRFFANISHEFRTPLNLILAPLQEHASSIPPPEIAMMKRNADRLLRLVNQLLDLAKIEVGLLQLEPRNIEISSFLTHIAHAFTPLSKTQNIDFQIDIPERDYILQIDPDKLEKIVYNLLSNAFKFTPAGGKVSINTRIANKQQLHLTVSDTGIGIAEESKDKIFDRFYQVDSSTTRPYEGTGIGLALIKELVELFDGQLLLDSQIGSGSVFTVQIPVQVIDNDSTAYDQWNSTAVEYIAPTISPTTLLNLSPIDQPEEKQLLLWVEDNSDLRMYVSEKLSDHYHIIAAKDGEEGLAQAKVHIPDLIVSDIMMPKMNGIDMIKAIRSAPVTSHIPVILLTAREDSETKIKGFETGAEQFLLKPFSIDELIARINGLLEQRKLLQEKFGQEVILQPQAITLHHQDANLLEKLVSIIEDNMEEEKFSVNLLQKEIGMSRMQLHRKLKALTNQSTSEFIRSIKLKRAAQILQQGGVQITEVAYQSGFNHLSYFAKCFKDEFGLSPSEYQKQHS